MREQGVQPQMNTDEQKISYEKNGAVPMAT
jgi:hypothetical protein